MPKRKSVPMPEPTDAEKNAPCPECQHKTCHHLVGLGCTEIIGYSQEPSIQPSIEDEGHDQFDLFVPKPPAVKGSAILCPCQRGE